MTQLQATQVQVTQVQASQGQTRTTATSVSPMPQVHDLIARGLRPHVEAIDHGQYPASFMRELGALGGFRQAVPREYGGAGRGLAGTLEVMEAVAAECLSTGFCVWCQTVSAWYVQSSDNEHLKREWLPAMMQGERLAGTGMSNPMKHFAGIEKLRLKATPTQGGYLLSGALPWVSNVGAGSTFAVVAQLEGGAGDSLTADYLMAMVAGDQPGLTLGDGGRFIALEGSSTYNAVFREVFIPDDQVLAKPCQEYIGRIRPGFILAQSGFGLGLVAGCLERMERSNERAGHVNRYLDDGVEELGADYREARRRTFVLAEQIGCGGVPLGPEATHEAVACRILASELSLRASQAAMLHAGAAGYKAGAVTERKLRESYFVAIVTPALKHLKKLQASWS
ncbi:acyl-CoA dehydrogenase family protein [Deinococcus altitudinis]|uniref:acyl-CoA dehydrogenase family protein n=1 Tax=Deinococcus altitudinis TaxID=468914 RepID=UPI0038921060